MEGTVAERSRFRAVASYRHDEAHYRLVWLAVGAELPVRRALRRLSWVALPSGLLLAWWLPGAGLAVFALGAWMALRHRIDRERWLTECRRGSSFGADVEAVFSDRGIEIATGGSRGLVEWGAPMEDMGPVLAIGAGSGSALYVPWAALRSEDARAEVLARMATAPPVESIFDQRTLLLLAQMHHGAGDDAHRLLYALLCDPDVVDRLLAEGVDVGPLEAAVTAEASVWEPPREETSSTLQLDLPPADPDRKLSAEDLLATVRKLPELAPLFAEATRGPAPRRPRPTRGVVLTDDDETPFAFVIDQLRICAGLPRLEAARITMRVHDAGEAIVSVDDPEAVAARIRAAASAAGWPLSVHVR